jgi:hypothetical protein
MYNATYDAQFSESVTNIVFPNVLVAAAAFWNYEGASASSGGRGPGDSGFMAGFDRHVARIAGRSAVLAGCPLNCTCSPADKCGVPYPH